MSTNADFRELRKQAESCRDDEVVEADPAVLLALFESLDEANAEADELLLELRRVNDELTDALSFADEY